MDNEIHFGDMQQQVPQSELRPDQNRHYAVVACQSPQDHDLPIFVEVDVLREIESHAVSDMRVELGGVLLGGQFHDQTGQPFVVITDSLRAEHYENTQGSFKFTHDTWAAITRQREQFPAHLQMVGWYHTHPNWGVFLSGRDDFICENFFNRPLDVALVVDPCQWDRAFFQWSGQSPNQTRRTGGFFVIGSRFRLPELQLYVAQLQERMTMPNDPRDSNLAADNSPPTGQWSDTRSVWLPLAILGSLTIQFLLVVMIAWRMLFPVEADVGEPRRAESPSLAGQRAALDLIVRKLKLEPDDLVDLLQEQAAQNEQLLAANAGLMTQVQTLRQTLGVAEGQQQSLETELAGLRDAVRQADQVQADQQNEILALQSKLAAFMAPEDTEDEPRQAGKARVLWSRVVQWKWYVGGFLLLALAAVLMLIVHFSSATGQRQDEDPHENAEHDV